MKLESFGISNFKAFGQDIQRMPLKPITLIFGPNSAGKSSALHSLLWLHHALKTGDADVRFPICANGQVDLGSFGQTLHDHDTSRRVVVELRFSANELPVDLHKFWKIERHAVLDLSFGRFPTGMRDGYGLADYRLRIDDADFLTAIRSSVGLSVSVFALDHPALNARIAQLASHAPSAQRIPETLDCAGLLPDRVVFPDKTVDDHLWDEILPNRLSELVCSLSECAKDAIERLRYVPPLREMPQRYFDLNESDEIWQRLFEQDKVTERVNIWLASDAFKIKYALHVNEYYSRTMLEREIPTIIGAETVRMLTSRFEGNEEILDGNLVIDGLLKKYRYPEIGEFLRTQPDLLEKVLGREFDYVWGGGDDAYLRDHYGVKEDDIDSLEVDEVRQIISGERFNWEVWVGIDQVHDGDPDAIELFQRWAVEQPALQEFMERHIDSVRALARLSNRKAIGTCEVRREITLRHKRVKTEVSLQDVGVGISQVLPVILHAFGAKENLIAIEQPEIHIHPALQAALGDVFIESALGENKNTFLLETHSEHLILRILRRIRETTRGKLPEDAIPVRPEDIAVLYVQPGEDGSIVRELRVNDQGRFIDDWPNGFFEERFNEEF
jgi:hypothetical protein